MKTAKQEAIEKAYVKLGFNWEEIKNDVDVMGCLLYDKAIRLNSVLNVNEIDNIFGYIRPKSLKGIEENNGWIRIESEEDLPKEEGRYYTISNQNEEIVTMKFPVEKFDLEFNRQWWLKYVTHYQKVTLPERPIY